MLLRLRLRTTVSRRTYALSIIAIVVVVASVAGYQIYESYFKSGRVCVTNTTTSPYIVDLLCNGLGLKLLIVNNSTVNIPSNSSTVVLMLNASNIRVDLNISGNYDDVTLTHGESNIIVTGNDNAVDARETIILGIQNTGYNNTIQR